MSKSKSIFSDRFGYHGPEVEIVIREDAPPVVRDGVLMLGYDAGLPPSAMRDLLCVVLLKRPNPNNWSAGNVENEVSQLIDNAPWYKVYDFAERLYQRLKLCPEQEPFELKLNQLLRERGVGWEMQQGALVARGSQAFGLATGHATEALRAAGTPTAANEMLEALRDISRRPHADITGAIQHAIAALECVAREVDGSTDTLGPILRRLNVPKPLDEALIKLWGFSSEQGRHLIEGRQPRFEDAELVVTVASAVSIYLLHRRKPWWPEVLA